MLNVMTAPKLPSELISEESIEAILHVAKRALACVHCDALNACSTSFAHANPTAVGANSRGRRGGGRGRRPLAAHATSSSVSDAPALAATLTLIVERLPALALGGLSDPLLHQLTSLAVKTVFGTMGLPAGGATTTERCQ